jgi:hypothetical protein
MPLATFSEKDMPQSRSRSTSTGAMTIELWVHTTRVKVCIKKFIMRGVLDRCAMLRAASQSIGIFSAESVDILPCPQLPERSFLRDLRTDLDPHKSGNRLTRTGNYTFRMKLVIASKLLRRHKHSYKRSIVAEWHPLIR